MLNEVTRIPAAPTAEAMAHFQKRLMLETDCADVHAAFAVGNPGFVLVDVRGRKAFAASHVPGAINIPVLGLTERRLAEYPADTLFVVYCAGPHCNGADKGALRLAGLGRPVKLMIGGMTGWADEGFSYAGAAAEAVA
ncbi:MAG: rhodanese-like domain-containing protein [Niveispirillum sp.]|uniref:rhodanese-like domain-containing protein n=1 Tax=Niveispirillum sp. TaxID=1917217 RepID=UPI003BA7588D